MWDCGTAFRDGELYHTGVPCLKFRLDAKERELQAAREVVWAAREIRLQGIEYGAVGIKSKTWERLYRSLRHYYGVQGGKFDERKSLP